MNSPSSGSGGSSLGHPEKPASDELRQAESLPALLLRKGHHAEGKGMLTFYFLAYSLHFYCPLLEIVVLFAVKHDQIDGFRVVPDQKMIWEITKPSSRPFLSC